MCILTNNTSRQVFQPPFIVLRNRDWTIATLASPPTSVHLQDTSSFQMSHCRGRCCPLGTSVLRPRFTSDWPSYLPPPASISTYHTGHSEHGISEYKYSTWQNPWHKIRCSARIFNHYYYSLIDINDKLDFLLSFCTTWFIQSHIRRNVSLCKRSGQAAN